MAIMTSLPEVGNLLGRNCRNMAFLPSRDLLDDSGPFLDGGRTSALVGALFAIGLTAQTLVEVLKTEGRRLRWLELDRTLWIATCAFGIDLVIRAGTWDERGGP